MNSKEVKQIRGQIRQLVKELIPEVLTAEQKTALYRDLSNEITNKLENIQSEINTTLKLIDNRSKDVQSMVVREMQAVVEARASAPAKE